MRAQNFLKNSKVLKIQLKFVSAILTPKQIKSEITWIVDIIFEHLNIMFWGYGILEDSSFLKNNKFIVTHTKFEIGVSTHLIENKVKFQNWLINWLRTHKFTEKQWSTKSPTEICFCVSNSRANKIWEHLNSE